MPTVTARRTQLVERWLARPLEPGCLAPALASWGWLTTLAGQQPFRCTAFGDLLLDGPGGVWFLDVVEGVHALEWTSRAELDQFLDTWEGREVLLLEELVDEAREQGLAPSTEEVLGFRTPPHDGGELAPENLEVQAASVALALLGRAHRLRREHRPARTPGARSDAPVRMPRQRRGEEGGDGRVPGSRSTLRGRQCDGAGPSYLVGAGITLSSSGAWERGAALILEGHRLNPGMPAHTRTWLAMGHLVAGDDAAALAEAAVLPAEGYVWGPLYRAMALSGLGYLADAREEAALVRQMRPDILEDPAAYFEGRMKVTAEGVAHLVERLDRLRG